MTQAFHLHRVALLSFLQIHFLESGHCSVVELLIAAILVRLHVRTALNSTAAGAIAYAPRRTRRAFS